MTSHVNVTGLLDEAPVIHLPGWDLVGYRAVPHNPTPEETQSALQFAETANESSPYWIGDILNYTHSREEWQEVASQIESVTGKSHGRIKNLSYVSKHVAPAERALSPSLEHALAVANLHQPEQQVWLDKARTEGWTLMEFRQELRAAKRRGVVAPAELSGLFHAILCDPPWLYNDSGVINAADNYGRAARHYPGMTIEELCKLPVADHAMPDAVLFCWVTAPMLLEHPGPREVLEAWGFKPKTGLVWDKVAHNFGHYVSIRHEHLIIATRGSCTPDHPTPMPDSVQTIRRSDVHSEKPEEFRRLIEQLYDPPYLEIFARRQVPGWTCWGNQLLEEVVDESLASA